MSFTSITRTGEVLQEAIKAATSAGNSDIRPGCILVVLLEQEEGIAAPLLEAVGASPPGVLTRTKESVAGYSSASGVNMADPQFNRDAVNALNAIEELAGELGDEYVSTETLFIGVVTGQSGAATILQSVGATVEMLKGALTNACGLRRVTTENLEEQYQALKRYTTDLTARVREGEIDPVIGRDVEIHRVVQVLSRRTKNNPVLIGEPGAGKTAIVERLARRTIAGDVPESLRGKTLMSLNPGSMVAGAKYRGEFEERLKAVLDETKEPDGQITTFTDEIRTTVGAGATGDGSMDVGSTIKPILARGELCLVGATTLDKYREHIEKDAAPERRFQQTFVGESSVEDAIGTLRGLKERYEVHHGVCIQDSALVVTATLSDRCTTLRFLPNKTIGLVNEAVSCLRMEIDSLPEEIDSAERIVRRLKIEEVALKKETDITSKERLDKSCGELADEREELNILKTRWQSEKSPIDDVRFVREKLDALRTEPEKAGCEGNHGRAVEPRYGRISELEKKLEAAEESVADAEENSMPKEEVTPQEVAEIVSAWTGTPAGKMIQGETEKLLGMELNLGRRVVGQDTAVEAVSDAVRRSHASITDPSRPTGSFLFLGPTGVGKTELAKALVEFLFNDERAMVCTDMFEYGEKRSVARLIGAPPGHVGYDAGGQPTEAVRRRPYTVVPFDEVEKAHPDMFDVLLQVLDESRPTSGRGRTVDFRNTILILTFNLGAGGTYEQVMDVVKMAFKPEFINRLDDAAIFNSLTSEQLRGTVDIRVRNLVERLEARRLAPDVADGALDWLSERGYDPAYGARSLRRLVQKAIGDELVCRLFVGDVRDGDRVEVTTVDDGESLKVVGYDEDDVARV